MRHIPKPLSFKKSSTSYHFELKKYVRIWSREKSKEECLELIPHHKDGTIQNPDSHGNDPNPPKDKN